MQAFLFYLTYPLIYLVASLPFKAMYVFSDFLYYILKLSGYRQKVVLQNLRNSFPEKSEKEIQEIAESFYRYLCDLILETLKTLKTTEKEAKERCYFHNPEWLNDFHREKKKYHSCNGPLRQLEWAGPDLH